MKIPHLTEKNKYKFFGALHDHETLFTYSQSFTLRDVYNLAAANNINVKYCAPGTDGYRLHGCFTVEIVKENPKTKITLELPAAAKEMILKDPEGFKKFMKMGGFDIDEIR